MEELRVTTTLWRYPGDSGWHFVTLPHHAADEIADHVEIDGGPRRGFGAVRVEVTCGSTSWRTSLFPDNASRSYVLPMKQAVRRAEELEDGDPVTLRLRPVND